MTTSKNLDRAMNLAREYNKLVAMGDSARARQVRTTIEDLNVGRWVDGKYTLPDVVLAAMGCA